MADDQAYQFTARRRRRLHAIRGDIDLMERRTCSSAGAMASRGSASASSRTTASSLPRIASSRWAQPDRGHYCWVVGCHVGTNLAGTAARAHARGHLRQTETTPRSRLLPEGRKSSGCLRRRPLGICLRSASDTSCAQLPGAERDGTSCRPWGRRPSGSRSTEPSTRNQIGAREAAGANVIGCVWQAVH